MSSFRDSRYFLTTASTWTEAEAQAQAAGGHLVTINDVQEQQFLLDTFGTGEFFWIGLTDQPQEGQDQESLFRWVNGEPVTFTNWVLDEPNNLNDEDYTSINQHIPGGWNDVNGQELFRGIVEVKQTTRSLRNGGDLFASTKLTGYVDLFERAIINDVKQGDIIGLDFSLYADPDGPPTYLQINTSSGRSFRLSGGESNSQEYTINNDGTETIEATLEGWDPGDYGDLSIFWKKRTNLVALQPEIGSDGSITYGYRVDRGDWNPQGNFVSVGLYYAKGDQPLTLITEHGLKLNAGAQEKFKVLPKDIPSAPPDADSLVVRIDKDNKVPEINENDNSQKLTPPLPNLVVLQPRYNTNRTNKNEPTIEYGYQVKDRWWDSKGQNVGVGLYYAKGDQLLGDVPFDYHTLSLTPNEPTWFSYPTKNLPPSPIGADRIVAVIDKNKVVLESNESDNTQSIPAFFVRKIPQIERNLGDNWEKAAQFLERWLNGKSKVLKPPKGGQDFRTNPDIEPVKLNWILNENTDTDGRARNAYNKLLNPDYLFSRNGKRELKSRLLELLVDSPKAKRLEFGKLRLKGERLHAQETQFSPIYPKRLIPRIPALDPLQGAMGNFSFYAIPRGEATVKRAKGGKTSFDVKVNNVGIYVLDSFDFNGEQEYGLGYWKEPDKASRIPGSGLLGYTKLDNPIFRDYRNATGLGEDFLTMSNVKIERFPEPIHFNL